MLTQQVNGKSALMLAVKHQPEVSKILLEFIESSFNQFGKSFHNAILFNKNNVAFEEFKVACSSQSGVLKYFIEFLFKYKNHGAAEDVRVIVDDNALLSSIRNCKRKFNHLSD